MFIPSEETINKQIIDSIEHIFFITGAEQISLDSLVPMIKIEFKKNYETLKFNGKVRNIHFFIKTKHKTISNFINNYTDYKIINKNNLSYIIPITIFV